MWDRTASSFARIGQDAILNNQFAKAPDWNWFQLAAMQYIHKINKRGDAFEVLFTGYASQQHTFTQFDLGLVELTAGPRVAIDQDSSFKFYGIGTYVDARASQVHRIERRRLLHSRPARQLSAWRKAMSSTAIAASSIRMNSRRRASRPAIC